MKDNNWMGNVQLLSMALLCFLLSQSAKAQDPHFSQFYNAPILLSPALTGLMERDLRVHANYRSQWGSVATPFTTLALSTDFSMNWPMIQDDLVGLGFVFLRDKAGTTQLKNTQLHLAGAYSKSLNRSGNHFVSFGGQIGYAWRRLSIDRLLFDNQFDGQKLNPALSSGEDFQEMERGYIDLTAGIGWSFAPDRYTNYYAGFALAHLNRPAVGFLDEEESLYRKKTFYAGGEFRLTYSLSIMPQAVYMVQGPSRAVNVGALLKVNMASANSDDPTTIYIGTMTRFKDAQVLLIRFDYGALGLSYSYDLNISGLRRASNGQGASELALMYRASLMNRSRNSRPVKCPSF